MSEVYLKKILKNVSVFAEVIKSHYVHLYNMTPYNICIVLQSTYIKSPYRKLVTKKESKITLLN